MTTRTQTEQTATQGRNSGLRRSLIIPGAAVLAVVAGLAAWLLLGFGGRGAAESASTYVVKRGDLTVKVLESGSLKALKSLEIKSEVEGQTTILSIVSEGTTITEDDVRNGRILVELDSSALQSKRTQQEITFRNAESAYTQARESYDIQLKQNESDVKAGELTVKFAHMDLQKYLGAELANKALASVRKIDEAEAEALAAAEAARKAEAAALGAAEAALKAAGEARRAADEAAARAKAVEEKERIDFAALVADQALAGEALQRRRILESDIDLSKEEVSRAQNKLNWTRDLEAKGYVTRDELAADELALKRTVVEHDQAMTALDLFLKYEFPKEAEKLLSDYNEARRELERTNARARSKEAQAKAELLSKEATYNLQQSELAKLNAQIEKCTIRAAKPGLVVYAGSSDPFRRQQESITEGASVRERQALISLPDLSVMAVDVRVHESSVKKVKKGQTVIIRLDAFPDMVLNGVVNKVGDVPDSQGNFLNPDLKVYLTEVVINGHNDQSLKPGLTAKVEIIAEELKGVLTVPVQAVFVHEGRTVCYVQRGGVIEARPVLPGSSDNRYVQILAGLQENETALLREPKAGERVEAVEPSFAPPSQKQGGGSEGAQPRGPEAGAESSPKNGESASANGAQKRQEGQGAGMAGLGERFSRAEMAGIFSKIDKLGDEEKKGVFAKMKEMDIDELEKYLRKEFLGKGTSSE